MTQGDPLPPTVFNVVVDEVVWHWVIVVVDSMKYQGGHGQEGRHQNALFYIVNGMVASPDSKWLQGGFITLVGLFDRMGLNTNVGKTVGMVFRQCQAAGTRSEAVCGRRMIGEDHLYWERQRGRIQYKESGEDMALRLLAGHIQTQHGQGSYASVFFQKVCFWGILTEFCFGGRMGVNSGP